MPLKLKHGTGTAYNTYGCRCEVCRQHKSEQNAKRKLHRNGGAMATATKKVNLDLTECDGNAFSLMGRFSRQARREGWTAEEIKKVTDDCMSGDYDHLLQVLIGVTQ